MSDFSMDDASFRQALAEIDRTQAETRKLLAEQSKLFAEQRKLAAEADKFQRDRYLAPVVAAAAVGAVVASVFPTVLRAWGVH